MNSTHSKEGLALWLAACLSVLAFTIAWLTEQYPSTIDGYYDSESNFWDYVVAIELVLFGCGVARLLWMALIRDGGHLPILRSAVPFLLSVAFLGYAFVWLLLLFILAVSGRL